MMNKSTPPLAKNKEGAPSHRPIKRSLPISQETNLQSPAKELSSKRTKGQDPSVFLSPTQQSTTVLSNSHEPSPERMSRNLLNTPGPSSLCPRCEEMFLDANTCEALIGKGRREPYRIDHYTLSEIKKYADYGCPLCSVLSSKVQRDDRNMGSFFEICPIPAIGLRNQIMWAVDQKNVFGQPLYLVVFYYFAVPESPVSSMIPSRPILYSVTNEKATERIERSFTQCLMNHEECPRTKANLLPSRVIDVQKMHLHETREGEIGIYAALSYCWGGDQPFKTTSDSISSMKRGFTLEDIPLTLQDAIKVCKQLKIQYLWIDALCIIQNDDEDKGREISQMGRIYNQASLVIAASRAKSVYDGFLADIKAPAQKAIMLPSRFSKNCEGEIGLLEVPMENSGREPLNQRGWTYQEISLATRALIYTNGGIIWQCNFIFDRLAYDSIQIGHHPSEDLVVVNKEFKAGTLQREEWDQLVRIFTLRNLTDASDRLEALAGIAVTAALFWNTRYYAGLWEYDMECQLGWRLDDGAFAHDFNWCQLQAPSWSWASVNGPVCNVVQWVPSVASRSAKVISCEVTPARPGNPFGRVTCGRLTIEAFVIEASYADPTWLDYTCMDFDAKRVKEVDIGGLWCLLLGCATENGMENDAVPQWYGLLLSCLPDGTFTRVGYFSQDLDPDFWSDDDMSFEEYCTGLREKQSLGLEARFPVRRSRRTVVIV